MSMKKLHLSNRFKLTATALAVIFSMASVIPSFAADSVEYVPVDPFETSSSSESTTTDETLVPVTAQTAKANASTGEVAQDIAAAQTECADLTNPNGLAAAAAAAYQDRNTIAAATPNIDKLFDIANDNGCFSALKDFPNLSASIPSLSSIAGALKNTLIKYATRKVCKAVNEALSEVVDPINDAIDKVAENGEIDLAGIVNKGMINGAYKIDPELGRVTQSADSEEYKLSGLLTNDDEVTYTGDESTSASNNSSSQQNATNGGAVAKDENPITNILDKIF